MPKVVDYDARRAEIIQATWRLIAREGISATTMRRLASELGFANGALAAYYPNKYAILNAAFEHVFTATSARYTRARATGIRGIDALRAFLVEIFPFDDERLLEARIAIGFFEFAAHDDAMRDIYDRAMAEWNDEINTLLDEMIAVGAAPASLDKQGYIDHVIAVTAGVQVTAVLEPRSATSARLTAALESLLRAASGQLTAGAAAHSDPAQP